MPPLLPGRRWGNRGRPAGRHAPRLPAALCVLRRPGSHGEWGGGQGRGTSQAGPRRLVHKPWEQDWPRPGAPRLADEWTLSLTARRPRALTQLPQGPHPAAPSPGEQSGRHSSDSPVTALWAGGTARQALPGLRVPSGASLGCAWEDAGMPGRVGLAGAARGCGVFSLLLLL